MDLQLTQRRVVVVGGARGIGLAIAREFAREGCQLALLDRAVDTADTAQALAREFGVNALGLTLDAVNYAEMKSAAATVQAQLGGVQHLVFAVGIGSGKFGFPFWNLEPDDWPRVLEINVLAAVNTLHAFVPALLEAGSATVLLISSVAGQMGSQSDPPYSAAKAALINFAQCAAKDLAPHNVRVNTLCPGMVQTVLNRAVWEAWQRQQPADQQLSYEAWTDEKIRKVVPLGRWQTPEDMAALAVFLASPRAENICGQTLNVDGGFVMHW